MNYIKTAIVPSAAALLCACAQIPEGAGENPSDPYEVINRRVYEFNRVVDEGVMKPIAQGYKKITPDFIEKRVSNASSNLVEPSHSVNSLLQGKADNAIESGFRFLVNSTFGIFGMFDVAGEIGLNKHEESFGNTLASWGVGQGSYIVLPILGPTTTRDVWSYPVMWAADPTSYVFRDEPWWSYWSVTGLRAVDLRARLLQFEGIRESTIDEYVAVREAYLQRRRKETQTVEATEEEELETLTPLNFDEE